MSNIRVSPSGNMFYTPSGNMGECGFIHEYAGSNCCLFLDPTPAAWNDITVYTYLQAVTHDSSTWYSTIEGNNQGNEPGVDAGWTEYTHCDNEDWDSVYPFGGIGGTPKYYAVTVESLSVSVGGEPTYRRWSVFGILTYYSECEWRTSAATLRVKETWSGNTTENDYVARLTLRLDDPSICHGIYGSLQTANWCVFLKPTSSVEDRNPPAAPLDIIGSWSHTWQDYSPPEELDYTIDWSWSASWKPLTCDFTLWDPDSTFADNACVAWNGKFYRSCHDSNTGNEPESDATNVCETGYHWRLED